MRPEIHDLIEAVRALGLSRTGKPSPRCIRIGCDPREFPDKLEVLQECLERVDASGALSSQEDASQELDRYRKALDGLLRFIQVCGIDPEPAIDIVANALELEGEAKREKAYETLPMFAPKGWKRKKKLNPRLHLLPTLPGDAGIADLKKIAFAARMTADWMGAGFVRESKRLTEKIERMAGAAPAP